MPPTKAVGGRYVRALQRRVGITTIKVAGPMSELMARDVVVWASGGAGCQTRALSPAPPQSAAPAQKSDQAKGSRNSQR